MNSHMNKSGFNDWESPAAGELVFPPIARIVAVCLAAVIVLALIKPLILGSGMPRLLPLFASIVSVVSLGAAGIKRDASASLMRVGFHAGLFAFFLSFPVISPDDLDPNIPDDVHWATGWVLLLTLAGFEVAYSLRMRTRRKPNQKPMWVVIRPYDQRWLCSAMCIGLLAWAITVWDYARSANASLSQVILTMRGPIEGATVEPVTSLGAFGYLFGMGISAAGVAASILVTAFGARISKSLKAASWSVILTCAAIGFLRGSRAVFLYSFVPLAATCWTLFQQRRTNRSIRWLWFGAATGLVIVAWSAIAAMRGADIRAYEGGWEHISPVIQARGAFDIYSALAVIVKAFPEQIEFEHGYSLVPLALGWVPRTVWPEKPYPFSLYASLINGETLEVRKASIAVGLPGEGYGNFGLAGALVWGALMGLACRKGDDYINGLRHGHPLCLHLAGFAGIWAAMIVRGGVPEMFYMGLNVIAIPVLMSLYLARRGRARYGRSAAGFVEPARTRIPVPETPVPETCARAGDM